MQAMSNLRQSPFCWPLLPRSRLSPSPVKGCRKNCCIRVSIHMAKLKIRCWFTQQQEFISRGSIDLQQHADLRTSELHASFFRSFFALALVVHGHFVSISNTARGGLQEINNRSCRQFWNRSSASATLARTRVCTSPALQL